MDNLAPRLKCRFRSPDFKHNTPTPQPLEPAARPSTSATRNSIKSVTVPPRTRRFTLFPSPSRVRTDFSDKKSEGGALGVIESPQRSPETPYSGVPKIGEVEVISKVAKGDVKRVVVGEGKDGVFNVKEVVGTDQAADGDAAAALADGEVRIGYSRVAGLLFSADPKDGAESGRELAGEARSTTISLTENQIRKLRQAVATDKDLERHRQRTQRETKLLDAYQGTLDAQLQPLEELFFAGKSAQKNGSGDTEGFVAIERGIEKIRGKVADAEREKTAVDSRLSDARKRYEKASRVAFAVLAGVFGGEWAGGEESEELRSEEEGFAKRYRVPESFLWD